MCVQVLILSKDRPYQLHLLLQSLQRFLVSPKVTDVAVLFKSTKYKHAYTSTLTQEFPQVDFIEECNFRRDWISLLARPQAQYVLLLTDDSILLRTVDVREVLGILQDDRDVLGVSLRLGLKNTRWCHTLNRPQTAPQASPKKSTETWAQYRWSEAHLDFGYPLEVSASVYPRTLILKLAMQLEYTGPNEFEHQMHLQRQRFSSTRPWLACLRQTSLAVTLPVNVTQHVFANRHGHDARMSIDALLELFVHKGQRPDLDLVLERVGIPNAAHYEANIVSFTECSATKD